MMYNSLYHRWGPMYVVVGVVGHLYLYDYGGNQHLGLFHDDGRDVEIMPLGGGGVRGVVWTLGERTSEFAEWKTI